MARIISDHRPDGVPGRSPARFPALEMSVQGKPPHRRSIGPRLQRMRDQLMRRTSPRLGVSGQCAARAALAAWSVSQCQTTVPPVACSMARSRMPLPENMEPMRKVTSVLCSAIAAPPPAQVAPLPEREPESWVCLYREKTTKDPAFNAGGVQRVHGCCTTTTILPQRPALVNNCDIGVSWLSRTRTGQRTSVLVQDKGQGQDKDGPYPRPPLRAPSF